MYQALYRKYRPATFDEVAGQEHITETLKRQVQSGKLSHAYLFIGTRGTGKTTCAKILARAVNCQNPTDGNPCNKCDSCVGIESGGILDVVEMDAASNNGVDNVRALREEAVFSPASLKKRVYIVDEVHMLSISAFNALLKILEEPPPHLVFILATTELHKVPATILSRCQRHSFRRLGAELIATRLKNVAEAEGLPLQSEAAGLLGRLADGSLRDGLSLLDQCAGAESITRESVLDAMGMMGASKSLSLMDSILKGDAGDALTVFGELWRLGKNPAVILGELSALIRDALIIAVAPKGGEELISGAFDTKILRGIVSSASVQALMPHLEVLQKAMSSMRTALSPRITAEVCLVSLCSPEFTDYLPLSTKKPERKEPASGAQTPVSADETPTNSAQKPADAPEQETKTDKTPAPEIISGRESNQEEPLKPQPERSAEAEKPHSTEPTMDKLLAVFAKKLDAPTMAVLGNSFQADISLADGVLNVKVKNDFAYGSLSKPETAERIRLAAEEAAGFPVKINVSMGEAPRAAKSLDDLRNAGFIRFE